jgi:hypothetical protein
LDVINCTKLKKLQILDCYHLQKIQLNWCEDLISLDFLDCDELKFIDLTGVGGNVFSSQTTDSDQLLSNIVQAIQKHFENQVKVVY